MFNKKCYCCKKRKKTTRYRKLCLPNCRLACCIDCCEDCFNRLDKTILAKDLLLNNKKVH
jgi:hypothetical protein